jgi:DNA-directed RNA polymerase subunit beta
MNWSPEIEKLAGMLSAAKSRKRVALQDGQFTEVPDSDVDFEFGSPNKFFGTHVNLIPLQSAVAGPRLFYGARFYNQALPLEHPEAPLVQALAEDDPDGKGRSFDEIFGGNAGAIRAHGAGHVTGLTPDAILVTGEDGKVAKIPTYNRFPFNRKTSIHNTAMVKIGDHVKKGQLLAKSNYTDDNGTLALGVNARVGLIPYKGRSMDDAIVVSESFAKRLTSQHLYGHDLDYKRGVRGGKAHYIGIFPQKFTIKQMEKLDEDGIVKPGAVLDPGDPIILATKPKVISSQSSQLGLLSKHMRNARSDAAVTWDKETPGTVADVRKLRSTAKVNVETKMPTTEGDKIVFRSGNKGIISTVIPDDHMPRTSDGKPLEVLLNPLSIPSRVNNSVLYELLLSKVAAKTGKPYKLPGFNQPGEKWYDFVKQELEKNGVSDTEEVFDPVEGKKLENPVTVGVGHVLKLHHTAESKLHVRGIGAYTADRQPLHGSSEAGGAKRLSVLETHSLMSSGAYNFLREGSTLRGQKNDEYWRMLRQGYEPRAPGRPFVWDKFRALLNGAGYSAHSLPGGVERLQFWTDRDLDKAHPKDVKTGDIVDIGTMEPIKGGLFDEALTGTGNWGQIHLPFPVPNPAAEDVIRKLLGLTEKQFRSILSGDADLPENLRLAQ